MSGCDVFDSILLIVVRYLVFFESINGINNFFEDENIDSVILDEEFEGVNGCGNVSNY